MLKSLLNTATTVVIAIGVFAAIPFATNVIHADQSKAKVVTIPATRTTPISGKQMYASYCAPCHGANGRGYGPVGVALNTTPADLTQLSRNNGGKFPSAHVASVLQFGAKIPAHGTSEMPVWGPVLGKMDQASPQDRPLRISNLSHYLETIQAK